MSRKKNYKLSALNAIVGVFIFWLIVNLIGYCLTIIFTLLLIDNEGLKNLAFSIVLLIAIFFFLYRHEKMNVFCKKFNVKFLYISFAAGISFSIFQAWLNIPFNLIMSTHYNERLLFPSSIPRISEILISQVIFSPIAEELFFRMYIQEGLHNNYSGFYSIVFSNILFAIVHFPDSHGIYITFIGGSISGLFYHYSKAVLPSIIFHSVWNFLSFIIY